MVALGIYIGTVNTLHAESLRGKIVVGRIEGVLLMIMLWLRESNTMFEFNLKRKNH